MARMVVGSAATLGLALGAPCAGRADEAPCATVHARDLPPAWADAVRELERQIAQLPATECQPQVLSIELRDVGVRVVAVASDGRRAERSVRQPAALTATALGLLISIPREGSEPARALAAPPAAPSAVPPSAAPSAAPSASSLAPAAPPPPPARVPEASAPPSLSQPPASPSSRVTSVWVGLALGGRVAVPGSITMADIEARLDVLLGSWLLFASLRDVPAGLQSSQGIEADPYRELGVGLGVGRRFALGASALDLGVEPSFVMMRMALDIPQPQPGGVEDVSGDDIEMRFGAFARLWLPLGRSWALTATVDTDVMPNDLFVPDRVQVPPSVAMGQPLPPFPAWTTGLRFGISGGLL